MRGWGIVARLAAVSAVLALVAVPGWAAEQPTDRAGTQSPLTLPSLAPDPGAEARTVPGTDMVLPPPGRRRCARLRSGARAPLRR